MESEEQDSREERAARNQALFRSVNEELRDLNESLAPITDEYAIVCECADLSCTESLMIRPFDYLAVRRNPRQFVVALGHVFPDVERVVAASDDGYVVVEKTGHAAVVAEAIEPVKD